MLIRIPKAYRLNPQRLPALPTVSESRPSGALSLAQSSLFDELIRNSVTRQSLQQISRGCLKVEPRGAATLELENKFYLVSTQPRDMGALFPVGQSKGQAAKGSFQVETVLGFVCRRHMLSPGLDQP